MPVTANRTIVHFLLSFNILVVCWSTFLLVFEMRILETRVEQNLSTRKNSKTGCGLVRQLY